MPSGLDDATLLDALRSSQRLGFLGAGPLPGVIDHALAFVAALDAVTGTVVDLGTGGGVPGLVIATRRPDLQLVLVDRRATRTDHLRRLVRRVGVDDRVSVLTADVMSIELDADADAAVARGFGAPERTLRAGVHVVRPGGRIIVSEPPVPSPSRWPPALLRQLGVAALPSPDRRVAVFSRHVPRET
jgi:16S rRNA (guanine527-N7)-methyltransferase